MQGLQGAAAAPAAAIVVAIVVLPLALIGSAPWSALGRPFSRRALVEQFEAAEPALRSLFSEPGVQGQFPAEVIRFVQERARVTVVTAEETSPGSGDARPRDAGGAAGKADALLEVAVDSVLFEQPWQFRRELVMVLSVHARLVRGAGGAEPVYEASLTYEGKDLRGC